MNKYEELAQVLMDAFTNQEIESNIFVGSTDTLNWSEIVVKNTAIYGVLTMAGGQHVKVEDGKLEHEYITLALALPNNTKTDYSSALEKINIALSNLVENNITLDSEPALFSVNGSTSTVFLNVKGGNQIGVLSIGLQISTSSSLLAASECSVTITPSGGTAQSLKGLFRYVYSKEKTFDSETIQSSTTQKNLVRSVQKSLTIDFRKIATNTLHQALATSDNPVTVTFNDGQDTLINGLNMHIAKYVQEGVSGGFVAVTITFIDGVVGN